MNVLVVEDDPAIAELVERVIVEEGQTARRVETLEAARRALVQETWTVVVLDWNLPDGDGVVLCQELRDRGDETPVLMLTARGEVADRVQGLRRGADDYLVKPFDVEELLARLDALQRRSARNTVFEFGPLRVDVRTGRAFLDGTALVLTGKEFALLARLARAEGKVVGRATLFSDVWHIHHDPGTNFIDVHVSRLRDKLGDAAFVVETVRGVGYRLRAAKA